MKRKWLIMMIFGISVFSQMSYAEYITLYETQSEPIEIADGVSQKQIQKYTDGGWLNLNVITVDLTKGSEMTVITDDTLSSRDTLTKLVGQSENSDQIVAAINSDFFDTSNNTTMGAIIKDGEVLTSGIGYDEFASFSIAKNGLPFIAYINHPVNTITNGKKTITLSYINKPYLSYDRIIMYDNNWSNKSYGKTIGQDIYEILVVDGVIKDYRTNGLPFDIPENGYVLSAVGKGITTLRDAYPIGDKLTINYDVNYSMIDLTIGGGAKIVSSGKVPTTFSSNITGYNPRTALGINKTRTTLYLVTVDGRTSSYRGVTQTELANIMISLGAYEAINLDGGGSTEMVVKDPFNNAVSIVNNPSDGTERKMYTGLAVVKNIVDNATLKSIQIQTEKKRYLLGEIIDVSLKAIDTNYSLIDPDNGPISLTYEGVSGEVGNGYYLPNEAGSLVITATYGGLTTTKTIEVFDDSVKLSITPSIIKMDSGKQTNLKFTVLTESGETISVSPSAVKVVVPEGLGTYNSVTGVFTGASDATNEGYLTVSINGLVTFVPVAIGTEQVTLEEFEGSSVHFLSYPQTVTGSYNKTISAHSGQYGGMLQYDFSNSTDTRAAYIAFDKALTLPTNTTTLGLWVYGNGGNDHWLRAKVTDATGATTNLTFAQHIDWTGWKYVTAAIPTTYAQPVSLDRIYLVETDATKLDAGYIIVDELSATVSQASTVVVPANITRITLPESYSIPSDVSKRLKIAYLTSASEALAKSAKSSGVNPIEVSGYSFVKTDGYYTMKLNNAGGSIRKNDYSQWQKLLADVEKITKEPLIVMMSSANTFTDSLESALLYKTLGALADRGIDVCIVYPTDSNYSVSHKEGVSILGIPSSKETLKAMTIGLSNAKIYYQITK